MIRADPIFCLMVVHVGVVLSQSQYGCITDIYKCTQEYEKTGTGEYGPLVAYHRCVETVTGCTPEDEEVYRTPILTAIEKVINELKPDPDTKGASPPTSMTTYPFVKESGAAALTRPTIANLVLVLMTLSLSVFFCFPST